MEYSVPIPFPPAVDAAEDAVLTEIDAAIAMVAGGAAVRVRIAGVDSATADGIAGVGAARAGAAGLRFRVDRSPASVTFTVGPRA